MNLIGKKTTNEIVGMISCDDSGNPEYATVPVPAGFDMRDVLCWKLNDTQDAAVLRTGPDLDAAIEATKERARGQLRKKYLTGVYTGTDTQQKTELVLDALVQIVDKLADGGTPSAQELQGWKKVVDGLKSDFKKAIKDYDNADKDSIKTAKKAVRKAEDDMTHDPEWPA